MFGQPFALHVSRQPSPAFGLRSQSDWQGFLAASFRRVQTSNPVGGTFIFLERRNMSGEEWEEIVRSGDGTKTLSQLATALNVHTSTAWRWALRGIGGKKLKTIKVGGRRRVRREDACEFLAALNAADGPPRQSTQAKTGQMKQIDAELKKMGL